MAPCTATPVTSGALLLPCGRRPRPRQSPAASRWRPLHARGSATPNATQRSFTDQLRAPGALAAVTSASALCSPALQAFAVDVQQAVEQGALPNMPADIKNSVTGVTGPDWLGPFILAFPLIVYAAFTVYRNKVRPEASILDFLFLLAALFIVLNVVTSFTLGIRLY